MPGSSHRIVLVTDQRRTPADAPAVRRYRLARLRVAERNATPPRRARHLTRQHD